MPCVGCLVAPAQGAALHDVGLGDAQGCGGGPLLGGKAAEEALPEAPVADPERMLLSASMPSFHQCDPTHPGQHTVVHHHHHSCSTQRLVLTLHSSVQHMIYSAAGITEGPKSSLRLRVKAESNARSTRFYQVPTKGVSNNRDKNDRVKVTSSQPNCQSAHLDDEIDEGGALAEVQAVLMRLLERVEERNALVGGHGAFKDGSSHVGGEPLGPGGALDVPEAQQLEVAQGLQGRLCRRVHQLIGDLHREQSASFQ